MTNQDPNASKWVARRVNFDIKAYAIIKRAARERGQPVPSSEKWQIPTSGTCC
jgi:hypothetical protein